MMPCLADCQHHENPTTTVLTFGSANPSTMMGAQSNMHLKKFAKQSPKINMGAPQLLLCLCLMLVPSSAFRSYPLQRRHQLHHTSCCTLALHDGHRPSAFALRRHFLSQSDEDRDDEYIPSKRGPPQGGDMAYIAKNIQRQMNTYQAIRQASMDCIHDVYVRQNTTYWYIGKLAVAGVTVEQGVRRQRNLMEEHATRLRPVELGRMFNRLEYWIAPGDSELECTLGNVDLRRVHLVETDTKVSLKSVGFFCEVVTDRGVGFSIRREIDGTVPRPFQ
jgi:hypothetical protein